MPSDFILNPMLRLRGYLIPGETLHVKKTKFLFEENEDIRVEREQEGVEVDGYELAFGIDMKDKKAEINESWEEAFASDLVPFGEDLSWEDEFYYPIE